MNILFAASEVFPYAKTGGLADVAGSLPKSIARLGHRVRVVMPRYDLPHIESCTERLPLELVVPFDHSTTRSQVFVDSSGEVPVYFIDAPQYFRRGRLYSEPDDPMRFAYFSRAVLELARALSEPVDILHLNDWMTGLVPVYLRVAYRADPVLSGARTVFTIHNLAFHGSFDPSLLSRMGLPGGVYVTEGGIEFYGQACAMKAGIVFSDAVTTVSPRYSREIQTPEFGEGLDGLLRSRRDHLYGILNGVDYEEWNPEIDPHIARRYSISDLSGKLHCKRDLLRTFGLAGDLSRPVIGCISRLSDQKGFDLVLDVAARILDRGVVLVVLGSGADSYERAFQALRDQRSDQVGVYLGFSSELAHKIEAGADMFLMPSRFEPCGLNQLYSLRYGTVPIVRAVGGLDDTIENFDRTTRSGNGFKFRDYDSPQLLEKVYEALLVYADNDLWAALVLNGMRGDYSWDTSARGYVEVFERVKQFTTAAVV